MKILKYFIFLFGLMTLTYTNINAQVLPVNLVPDIKMIFPNGEIADATIEVTAAPNGEPYGVFNCEAEIEVIVTSAFPRKLATVVRSINTNEILIMDYSESPTTSYMTVVTFDYSILENEAFVECGYIDSDDNYRSDSGCIVIIQP